ncbi:MAG: DNA translocase FtsK [Synergistaceae bacterium]|nr:DNA translocase FtsK [Synergistaceae bacterium]
MGRRRNKRKGNWRELILILLILLCLYFILALFGSSLVGSGGQSWGDYLRMAWGGAIIVPLLFWLYLCVAKLTKMRVPYLPRQILGTIQLYISFAFMLGLLKVTGWNSELTLFLPGNFGYGLANFFVLNLGVFITLLLVIMSFLLSAFFFGSKILSFSFPDLSFSALRNKFTNKGELEIIETPDQTQRRRRKPVRDAVERKYPEDRPENILFMKDLPAPQLKEEEEAAQLEMTKPEFPDFPRPKLKSEPEPPAQVDDDEYEEFNFDFNEEPQETVAPEAPENNYAIEIIDNLLASINAGALSMPEKKRAKPIERVERVRRPRRPVPAVNFSEGLENLIPEMPADVNNSQDADSSFPPPMDLFGPATKFEIPRDSLKFSDKTGKEIISTLKGFNVNASIAGTLTGPSVIQYLIELAPGMKINKIAGLDEELAMSLAIVSVRIEAPIPGTRYIGIEIPNPDRRRVSLRSVLESEDFQNDSARLPLALGVQFDGKIFIRGLEEISHLLVAGGKDSGKNTFLNASILELCSRRRPEDLGLILIDPRHVEFAIYEGLPHLITAPIFDYADALQALQWAVEEMESRTSNFASARVRTLAAYNRKLQKKDRLPEIVIVINELADLMYQSGNEIEDLIVRLAQKAGAAGIYMIIATQKPSADVITTLIRSNISARVTFSLESQSDSKNIIGFTDADKLTGQGDMLFKDSESQRLIRLQAPFISDEKVLEFVEYMGATLLPGNNSNFRS